MSWQASKHTVCRRTLNCVLALHEARGVCGLLWRGDAVAMCLDYYVMEDVYVSGRERANEAEARRRGLAASGKNVGRRRRCTLHALLLLFCNILCVVVGCMYWFFIQRRNEKKRRRKRKPGHKAGVGREGLVNPVL